MSLCLSEKCKDYGNSCHSDAVLCSLCNCCSDSGCHHSDVKNDFDCKMTCPIFALIVLSKKVMISIIPCFLCMIKWK